MQRVTILILLMVTFVAAGQKEDLQQLTDRYIDCRARFNPTWATSVGIFDYDSLLTTYSAEKIFEYRDCLKQIKFELRLMKPDKFKIDEYIDYQLLMANIKQDEFYLVQYPRHQHSAAIFLDEAIYGIYYLLLDQSRTLEEKAPFLLQRMRAIPFSFDARWEYQPFLDSIFYEVAYGSVDGGIGLLKEATRYIQEAMPDSAREIYLVSQQAISTLETFKIFCNMEKREAPSEPYLGKENLDYLLKEVYMLDIDSDSLKTLGWYWYEKADKAIDSLQQIIGARETASEESAYIDTLTKQDILDYYQWEINQTAGFFRDNEIMTIPDDIGDCIPIETPEFMRPIRTGIAYMPPPAFSPDQTGYFYVRPIAELDSAGIAKYSNTITNRGFKGSVVHEAYPGHHLQLSLANRNPKPIRKIQDNMIFCEGWALYSEEMATRAGLFGDDNLEERWKSVWGGVRFRAVRVIVDCCLAENSMSADSALVFMNEMLGDHTDYFTSEIRRYLSYPSTALSYLIGKILILNMLEEQKAKLGDKFSLKDFHDQLLAEGTIPPALIAKKLSTK